MKFGIGVAVLGGGGVGGAGDLAGGVGTGGVAALGGGAFETNFTIGLLGLAGDFNFETEKFEMVCLLSKTVGKRGCQVLYNLGT